MARFERSRKRDSRDSRPRRDSRGGRSFGNRPKGRRGFEDSRKRDSGFNRNRRDSEMTKVICSSCGEECEVPFKPTSSKPVYCKACFAKKDRVGSDKISNRDIDIINEKLNKIMKALDIE